MLTGLLSIAAVLLNLATATPLSRRDNTQPVGTNPIAKPQVTFLGFQTAENDCSHRDLGFTGAIAGKWYAVYGFTLYCKPGVTDPTKDDWQWHSMVRDSVSATTRNPLRVHDLNLNSNGRQNQFVRMALEERVYAKPMLLLNKPGNILKGASVAKVSVINGTPTVTQRMGAQDFWWASESNAQYGDIAAFRDPRSEYIYAWGHPPSTTPSGVDSQYVYMIRVKASEAFDLSKYQYWWGRQQGWKSNRLTTFTSDTAVMWGTGQGQVVWNAFYQCYIFVHLDAFGGGAVYLRTASSPEGPWTPDIQIYQGQSIDKQQVYAGVAHPYLDASGKSLAISYSSNNTIQVIKAIINK